MKDRILIHYVPLFLLLLINSHRVCIIFEAGTTPQWRQDPRSGINHVKGSLIEGLSKHSGIATKEKVIDILSSTHIGPVYPSNEHVINIYIQIILPVFSKNEHFLSRKFVINIHFLSRLIKNEHLSSIYRFVLSPKFGRFLYFYSLSFHSRIISHSIDFF